MKNTLNKAFLLQDIYGSEKIDYIELQICPKTSIFDLLHNNINDSKKRVTSYAKREVIGSIPIQHLGVGSSAG